MGMHPTTIQSSIFDNELWWCTWGTATVNEEGSSVCCNGTAIYTVSNVLDHYQLVKWNTNGNQLWNKSINEDGVYTRSVWCDGTYVYTAGDIKNPYTGKTNLCLYKWNANGVEQWHKIFNNTNPSYGYAVTGAGGALYTAGFTYIDDPNFLLVKWDAATGIEVWNRTWDGPGIYSNDQGFAVWTDGASVYVTGWININSGNDVVIIAWTVDGVLQWSRSDIVSGRQEANSIWGTGGSLYTCGMDNYNMVVRKFSTTGTSEWNRTWAGSSSSYGDGIMGVGTTVYTIGSTNADLLLVKWDSDGNQIWNQTWGGTGTEWGMSVWCNASTIYGSGSTYSYGAGGGDLLLIKCDVDRKPIVDIRLVNPFAYEDQATQFRYNGTDGDGITDYQWYFGDGTGNATGKSPSHTFTNPGEYDVVCTVVDADSDRNTKHRSVNITTDQTPAPDFAASTTTITAGGLVSFTRLGSIGDSPATFVWSFGDGTANSTQEGPLHVYTTPGTYTIILSVTDVDGDVVTVTKAGYIRVDAPTAPGISGFVPALLLVGAVVALAGLTKNLAKKTCKNRE